MTKQELEKSIKNGERVWYVDDIKEKIFQVDLDKRYAPQMFEDFCLYVFRDLNSRYKNEYFIERLFATKQQAKHYLCHANITRTEKLPFLTWEEFKAKERIIFTAPKRIVCSLSYLDDILTLSVGKGNKCINRYVWYFCEENFYQAYDKCVSLFKVGK